jgi:dimethylaniline monooxygenase (N-oxide forming)
VKRVAVIGAGPSGLTTIKELRDEGHDVVAFEARPTIGGVFNDTYDELQLTTSNLNISFGAFPDSAPRHPVIWPREAYIEYLEAYVRRFDLAPHIRFSTRVESVRREDGRWRIHLADRDLVVDHLAICTGSNMRPINPTWADAASFRGRIMHSSELRNRRELEGKRVLVVGLGESGSDIALLAARGAAATAISTRQGPGYVIPRFYRGQPSDLDTNRCYHSLPRRLVGTPLVRFKTRIEDWLSAGDDGTVLRLAKELNRERGLSPFHRFGTKNTSFIEAMVHHGADYRPDVVRLTETGAVFADGTQYECDTIVCCTGFGATFPFLTPHEPALAEAARVPRRLYKRMLHPEIGASLAWIGFVRPGLGSVPPCAEMQSRYFALLVSGRRRLPSRAEMDRDIAFHEQLDLQQFPQDAPRIPTLTDYLRFMEGMARAIGCEPPLRSLFFRDPRTWAKVMFAPITGAQYRLAGPGAAPEEAREWLRQLPTMPWPVLAYELVMLAGSRIAGAWDDRWRG